MNNYMYNIRMEKHSKNHGFIRGTIDDFLWFALIEDKVVETGINPNNLMKGGGRVVRLCIYKEDKEFDGNPFMPSMTIKRSIYANYSDSWTVLNKNYEQMIRDLIHYLERRHAMQIVK